MRRAAARRTRCVLRCERGDVCLEDRQLLDGLLTASSVAENLSSAASSKLLCARRFWPTPWTTTAVHLLAPPRSVRDASQRSKAGVERPPLGGPTLVPRESPHHRKRLGHEQRGGRFFEHRCWLFSNMPAPPACRRRQQPSCDVMGDEEAGVGARPRKVNRVHTGTAGGLRRHL